MANSIIFLGTGGDSIVVGKQQRSSSGIVLQLEGNQFVLDPGPSCLARASQSNVNIRDTVCVLVSHAHTNHANDVNAVLEAMSLSGLDRIGVLITNKKTVSGDEKENPILKKRSHSFVEKVLDIEAGTKIGINEVNIHSTKADHYDSDALGFIFEAGKLKVGYTGDTAYSDEIAEQYKGCWVLIANCKYPLEVKEPGHLNSDDMINLIKKVKPKLTILTHFGIKMVQSDPLLQAREIQKKTGVDVIAAFDGLVINPSSFSSMKQESLGSFK